LNLIIFITLYLYQKSNNIFFIAKSGPHGTKSMLLFSPIPHHANTKKQGPIWDLRSSGILQSVTFQKSADFINTAAEA
jgi:hypothetical protein